MAIRKHSKRIVKKYVPSWEREGITWAESVIKTMQIKYMSPQVKRSIDRSKFRAKFENRMKRLTLKYGKKKKRVVPSR